MQRILLVGACGPKKTASNGPGDIVPRQFNLPPPIQVRVLFGALRKEYYGEWDEFRLLVNKHFSEVLGVDAVLV